MVDLSKIPITERYLVFSKHKEKILSAARENPSVLDDLISYYIKDRDEGMRHCSDFIKIFLTFMDAEEIKILGNTDQVEDYSSDTVGGIKRFINAYLQYEVYSNEINNAFILHLKEDSAGRLMFGRAEKEIDRIANKNELHEIGYGALTGSIREDAQEIIYGEIANNRKNLMELRTKNNGAAFEKICEKQLKDLGYTTSLTKQSGDFGCDILAEKNGITYAIQCKSSSGKVGVKAVQEAATSRKYYKADIAVVVTNGEFTSAANELAVENKVIIINDTQIALLENLSL